MRKIIIRLAKLGDETGVAKLWKDVFKRQNDTHMGSDKPPNKKKIKQMRTQYYKHANSFIFLAEDIANKTIAGSMGAVFKKSGRQKHIITLGWMVHPDYQRQGMGTKLLKATLHYAKKKGFKRAETEVAIENKASWKMAIKCEFKIEGIKKKALRLDTGRYIDTYILGKLL